MIFTKQWYLLNNISASKRSLSLIVAIWQSWEVHILTHIHIFLYIYQQL